ncbi:hypothetical protein HDA40_003002 [Hamadaea flava]|uniref:DUF4180 domain-containing protein n=1 Tax=Hamadaea flava TaxID=1742688 RepID=A0ABV8LPP2_9ACTN|nr:DUF4180 domain-containing protein [Hamadaea flava]MCP2324495.1 hypothetical protein [Hamadaea flava]
MTTELHGVPTMIVSPEGPPFTGEVDVTDLIGDAFGCAAELVVLPADRLPAEFFTLRSGIAGAIAQKFVNYHIRLVIIGDISEHVERSTALRDFVVETNRGRQLWFLPTLADLETRLAGSASAGAPDRHH